MRRAPGKPAISDRLSAQSRGYDARWKEAARRFRAEHRFCLGCLAIGERVLASVVDHIRPHRGNQDLFWDVGNWQPCCEWHHNAVKKRLEELFDKAEIGVAELRLDSATAVILTHRYRRRTVGIDGWPI